MPRATAKVSKAVEKSVKVSAKKAAPAKRAAPVAAAPRRKSAAKLVSVPAPAANEDASREVVVNAAPLESMTTPVEATVEVGVTQVAVAAVTKPTVIKAKQNEPIRVQLPARLQINNLDGLYVELNKLMSDKKAPVVLDAGDISLVDSAGVQLLVAFFRSYQAGGGKVEWDNFSVQMYQMADELGISAQLGG